VDSPFLAIGHNAHQTGKREGKRRKRKERGKEEKGKKKQRVDSKQVGFVIPWLVLESLFSIVLV
jgi:hypothetical protein